MWCKFCNMETREKTCPVCGQQTFEDIPTEVHWCKECRVPIIREVNDRNNTCPLCGGKTQYLAADLRPVFPEERLLLEILLKKPVNTFAGQSVWAQNNRYYIDGKAVAVALKVFSEADPDSVNQELARRKPENEGTTFNQIMENFVRANRHRLNAITQEAHSFIRDTAAKFPRENVVISFSGGKDSTVTADLSIKALSDSSLVHIFGDTTLEFPTTIEYAKRYRADHPNAIFLIAHNDEQVFSDVCEDIGPPARMMRWCCSMFKTGPITRTINSLYRNQQILTFYGIRKSESVSRSKYNRVENAAESVKIQQQTVASPIFFWKDLDIWLYLLGEKVDFNEAYRLGYDRVGCWCCPNNNDRAQFLSRIYMPEKSKAWHDFLVRFAKSIGKPDAEEYVDTGKWKARQGGNGLSAANDIKIKFTNCTAEDHAKIYSLVRPYDYELVGMFVPFGKISRELGRKLLHEVLVLDVRTNVPILSIQPFSQDGYEHAVKVRTMNVSDHEALQRQVAYQIKKFNACRKCLKCESLCHAGAILIDSDGYHIDPNKCVHCKMCVTAKYLDGGCMMDKYLRQSSPKKGG